MKALIKLVTVVGLLAGIAGITIPLLTIRRIQAVLASSEADIASAVRAGQAITALRQAERDVYSFPVLAHNLNVTLISAYAEASMFDEAQQRAEWLRTAPDMASGRETFVTSPPGPLDNVLKIPNQLCYKLVARGNSQSGPFQWDRWIGYRTMLIQLDRDATRGDYARIASRIDELDAEGTFPREIIRTSVVRARSSKEIARNLHNLQVYDKKIGEIEPHDSRAADLVADRSVAAEHALPAWGVVKSSSSTLFSVTAADEGKSLVIGEVPVGSVVEITRIFAPRSMTLATCRLAAGEYKDKQAILKYETLATFPGPLEEAGDRLPRLESTRARLLLRIDNLKDGARQRKRSVPAVGRYLRAEKIHKAFYAEIRELMQIADGEVKGDMMKARDRLREMKYEQSEVDAKFQEAKSSYLEWRKGQHNSDAPALTKAREQLAHIESEIKSLVHDG
ncbi:MAG: hypothetical protein O2923_12890 [Verrucomicrobia bacterium]|nr:hypothetical protein [Verrucomicrobiota bacterium]MDA1088362.1 hypothetical protein [Verrucomicrobiota bacterium]